jgi:hypothetical protein
MMNITGYGPLELKSMGLISGFVIINCWRDNSVTPPAANVKNLRKPQETTWINRGRNPVGFSWLCGCCGDGGMYVSFGDCNLVIS